MLKRTTILLLSIFALLSADVSAQSCVSTSIYSWEWPSHNKWFFGNGQIGTFSGGFSVSNIGASYNSYEGTLTASDDNGNLLFFSNGVKLWNAAGTQTYADLKVGKGGGAASSAVVGDMVVKHPLEPDKFYIFTGDDAIDAPQGLKYFEVDVAGNVTAGPVYLSNTSTTEGLAAVKHANGVDIWVMSQRAGSTNFYAYLITCQGVQTTAVISNNGVSWTADATRGSMAFSADGTNFAIGHNEGSWANSARAMIVYKFDNATGLLSNKLEIAATAGAWGPTNIRDKDVYDVCFSPDGSKIYYSTNGGKIGHYDLSTWTQAAINSTWTVDATGGGGHGALEMGADGALYHSPSSSIRRLTGNINAATGLSYSGSLGSSNLGLPTMYLPPEEEPDIQEVGPFCTTDAAVDLNTLWLCSGLDAEDPTGTPASIYSGTGITNTGTGIFDPATAGAGVHEIIFTKCNVDDTIWITVNVCTSCTAEIQDVTPEICVGELEGLDQYVTTNSSAPAAGVWSIGTSPGAPSATISIAGTDTSFNASNLSTADGVYKVYYTVTDGAETCKDSINITVNPLPTVTINDQTICADGTTVTFDAGAGFTTYLWSDASGGQTMTTSTAGDHWVKVTDGNGCVDTDSATITVNALPVVTINDQTICANESVTFDAGAGFTTYLWSDASGGQTMTTSTAGDHWVKVTDGNGCVDSDSATITVNALPVVTINDQTICANESVTFDAGAGFTTYLWSDASGGQTMTTSTAGDHWVKVTDGNGCVDSDSATITVNALPVVTINDQTICANESVTFDAGAGYTTYLWSDASGGQTLTSNTAGDYWVKVTDGNGCVDSDSATISVNALPVVTINDQTICANESVTFDAGAGFTTYLWSDASGGQTLTTSTAGDHWVKVTDGNGCVDSDSATITVNALPVVTINDQTICADGSTVTFDAGAGFTTYLWSDASGGQTMTTSTAGDHWVKVTDGNGCVDSDSATIIVNALPVVTINDQTICANESVTFDAGAGFTTYLWSDASGGQTMTTSTAGDHWVKVTDGNGCTDSDSASIIVNALPVVTINDQTICANESVTFDAGAGFTTYLWSDASGGQTMTTSTAGDHWVKVTDGNGCVDSDSATITVNALPVVTIADQTICADGSTVTFDAGAGFTTYLWSDASGGQTMTTSTAGDHWVKVTDGNGCVDSDSATITVNALPVVTINDQTICANESVTFDAGAGFTTYLWSDASGGQTMTTSTAGDHWIKVTDGNGCVDSDSATITVNALPVVTINDQTICADGSTVTFDAGAGFTTYLWSDASGGQTLTTSTAGDHWIKVTDGNGCVDSDSATITVNALPIVTINDQTICANASVTFDAGAGFTTYLWSDATGAQTLTSNTAGDYWVKVTDGNGCVDSDSATITVNALPVVTINDQTICANESVTFDAGAGFTTYLWSDASGGQTMTTSTAGDHWVKVTDGNGCVDSDSATITVNALPVVTINDQTICADGSTVTFDAGAGFTTYLWNDATGAQTLTSSTAGDYWVKVTDGNGCVDSDSATITVNALPVVTLTNQTICVGGSVTFDAGAGFTTYLWNDATGAQTLSSSTAGDYWVKITDANGCVDSDSATITVNALPVLTLGNDTAICANDNPVTFDAGVYTSYLWSDATTNQTLTTSTAGTYKLIVTNADGCTDSDEVVLTVNALPSVNLGPDQAYCQGGNAVTFDAGTHTSYLWNDATSAQTLSASTTGEYIVEVTDANGCKDTDSVNLTVNIRPTVSLGPDVTICPGSSVTLDAGAGFVTYEWNDGPGAQTRVITDANPGTYTIDVIDANGCRDSDTVTIVVAASLSINLGNDVAVCDGNTVTLDAGNISGATYAWMPNSENTRTIDVTTTGSYSVLVTDPMGCSGRDTIEVTVNANPTLDLGPDQQACPGSTALIDAGNLWNSVTWNDGTTLNNITVSQAGKYYADVTDVNGCPANDTVELSFFANANVDLGSDKTVCPGTSASFDAGNFASYEWQDGTTNQTYNTTTEETVWVAVIDANGCRDTDSAEVVVRTQLLIQLGPDQSACAGTNITLDPNLDNTFTLAWNDGSSADTLLVTTSGKYYLDVVDVNGCAGNDTVEITINPNPTLDVVDQQACPNGDVTFDAGNTWASVNWSNGLTTNSITVNTPGKYYVDCTDGNGCTVADTMEFSNHVVVPVDLGADKTVCPGSNAVFNAGVYSTYVWQDGTGLNSYTTVTEETVWVEVTDANGCKDTDSALVVVRDKLLVDLGPDQSACEGTVITLDPGFDNTYNLTWTGGTTADTLNVTTTGEYIVDVVDANGCEGADTINITINANPTLDITDQNACPSASVTFDAGAGWSAVTWSDGSTANTFATTQVGKYFVDVTDANGCLANDTMEFAHHIVIPVDLGADKTVCPGSNANFNAGTYSSYVWQDGTGLATYSTVLEETVWVEVTDANGCKDIDSAEVVVRTQLLINLGPDQVACDGTTITLDPNLDNTYSLTWNDGSTGSTLDVTTSGTYYVDVTDANGCAGSDTIIVTINVNPTIDLGNDFNLCEGQDSTINAGNWASTVWDDGLLTSTRNINSTGTHSVTVTDANGCIGTDQITITVNPNPTPSLGPDTALCPGQDATFNTSVSYASYVWQDASTGTSLVTKTAGQISVIVTDVNGCLGYDTAVFTHLPALQVDLGNDTAVCEGNTVSLTTSFDPSTNNFNWGENSIGNLGSGASIVATVSGTYFVYVANGGGCAGYDEKVVTINANPIPNPGPDTSICAGESVNIDAGYAGAISYSWNSGQTIETINVNQTNLYTVTVVDTNGCTGSGSANLIVNALPVIVPNPDQTACENTIVTINPVVPNGTYLWNTGETTKPINVDSAGTYTITVTDGNGCVASDDIAVSYLALPEFDLGNDLGICDGDYASFGESFNDNGWVVSWNIGSSLDSITTDSGGVYIATATDANGCTYKDTLIVTLLTVPTPTTSPDTIVCFEEIESMYIEVQGLSSRDQVLWNTNQSNEFIQIDSAGTYVATVERENGCTATDTTVISEKCESTIYVPNAFTPGNFDNFNDMFTPKGINIRDYDLYVFNRWGEQIFHSSDMNIGWDGTYMGRLVQVDVYVWKIYYRTEEDHGGYKRRQKVGHVTVLR